MAELRKYRCIWIYCALYQLIWTTTLGEQSSSWSTCAASSPCVIKKNSLLINCMHILQFSWENCGWPLCMKLLSKHFWTTILQKLLKAVFCSTFIDSLIHNILNCAAQNFDGESLTVSESSNFKQKTDR